MKNKYDRQQQTATIELHAPDCEQVHKEYGQVNHYCVSSTTQIKTGQIKHETEEQ